jgi:rubrerythrin
MRVPTVEEFMSRAYAIELEAVERYTQFAEQMEAHNNREVASLFRRLAEIESLHARKILGEMRWPSVPAMPPPYAEDDGEGPETAPFDAVHYLMKPWHALEVALRCEQNAVEYFEGIARAEVSERVRAAAAEMAEDEREHVRLIREWMKKVPQPRAGWDEDPDPPRIGD